MWLASFSVDLMSPPSCLKFYTSVVNQDIGEGAQFWFAREVLPLFLVSFCQKLESSASNLWHLNDLMTLNDFSWIKWSWIIRISWSLCLYNTVCILINFSVYSFTEWANISRLHLWSCFCKSLCNFWTILYRQALQIF